MKPLPHPRLWWKQLQTKQGVGSGGQSAFRLALLSIKLKCSISAIVTVEDGVCVTMDSASSDSLRGNLERAGWTATEQPVWNRYTFRPNSHYTDAAEDDVIGGLIFQNDLSAGSILMSGPTFTEETKGKEGETYTCRRYFVTVSPEVEAILRENDGFLRLNAVDSVRLHPAPHRSDRPDGSGKSQ